MLSVSDCIADCVRLAVPEATEWQHIGNQIKAAFIFARADGPVSLFSVVTY
jgi:hypothetical protein